MAIIEMKVPVIGESVTEVTLSKWLVADGAYVNLDDPICEFESDKATLEFPAEAAGTLIRVAAEGADLQIGMLVAKIDTAAAKETAAPKTAAPSPAPEPAVAKSAEPAAASGESYATGHPSPAAAKI
ncbi:MAG: dihydrolipoyllysine-residue succinyltransferase, partial [Saprospiraceae bacterium]|nr:dihydrolipoyllysine-residue succinyltransferase [Saprospiraceae bacterium]